MGIIVDLLIVLLFIACIFGGYKRGLARCLLKILTSVIALVIAVIVHKPLVNFIVENTTIDDNIAYSLERVFVNDDSSDEKLINEDSGIPKPVVEYLNDTVQSSVEEKKNEAISEVSKSAAILIVNIAAIILIYIIAKILLKILTIFTDIVAKLPIIKQCNELGGIIYGILEAFVIILIVLTIISIITPLVGNYAVSDIIMQSYIGKFLYNNNLFLNLIF
jgi:uncharacterized membrane protein required for colicin V production